MSHIKLTGANFDECVKEGVCLVDFYATWCGPCRALSPVIEELAGDFAGRAKIAKVDVDEERELASRFGVVSIPTLLFFKDGKLKEQIAGAHSKNTLTKKLNELL